MSDAPQQAATPQTDAAAERVKFWEHGCHAALRHDGLRAIAEGIAHPNSTFTISSVQECLQVAADKIETLELELAEMQAAIAELIVRDGNWLDKWGSCRVCGGEIPYGHTNNCDIYKQEKETIVLRAEREALACWKTEQLTVTAWWAEIDDYCRKHPEILLGDSVSAFALRLIKERDALSADWQRVIKEVLACNPQPAAARADDRLEPPWDVIARVRNERDALLSALCAVRVAYKEYEAALSCWQNAQQDCGSREQPYIDAQDLHDRCFHARLNANEQARVILEKVLTLAAVRSSATPQKQEGA